MEGQLVSKTTQIPGVLDESTCISIDIIEIFLTSRLSSTFEQGKRNILSVFEMIHCFVIILHHLINF